MSAPYTPVSSEDLYDVYVAWRDCKEGDDHWETKTRVGLCCLLTEHGRREIYHQFDRAGLGRAYPFGGRDTYWAAFQERTQHLNPARIKWVNDRIADYERAHAKDRSDEPS